MLGTGYLGIRYFITYPNHPQWVSQHAKLSFIPLNHVRDRPPSRQLDPTRLAHHAGPPPRPGSQKTSNMKLICYHWSQLDATCLDAINRGSLSAEAISAIPFGHTVPFFNRKTTLVSLVDLGHDQHHPPSDATHPALSATSLGFSRFYRLQSQGKVSSGLQHFSRDSRSGSFLAKSLSSSEHHLPKNREHKVLFPNTSGYWRVVFPKSYCPPISTRSSLKISRNAHEEEHQHIAVPGVDMIQDIRSCWQQI